MSFIADFHIHSSYSMATSKFSNPYGYSAMATVKGIDLIGTGDITHPEYLKFLKENLVESGNGIYKLKQNRDELIYKSHVVNDFSKVRFILTGEISTIYKDGDKTRKIHHIVVLSSLEKAERFSNNLDKIGNIKSDGRPILGINSRNLYEILLESDPDGYIIPAHIWTPWFSLFGEKSGYNSIKECYKDLSSHIFACETGLSSDPKMNFYVPELDNITLVSNSDTHSPNNLGREANIFSCNMDFYEIKDALKSGNGFDSTIEFYPEEGKYYFDGHRKCNVSLSPQEAIKLNNICPVCGKKLTFGVFHRILELGDLNRDIVKISKNKKLFQYIIPLPEILSEILKVGVNTKKVQSKLIEIYKKNISDFDLLLNKSIDEIKKIDIPFLDEAILRLRNNQVIKIGGYDGEFGKIKLFKQNEL